MVMPRSRSRSIESSTCSAISRSASPPHIWMKRSASVDLPWSMSAMIEKFRMWLCGINKEGAAAPSSWAAILSELADRFRREAVAADLHAVLQEDRDVFAVQLVEPGIGIDVHFSKRDAKGPQGRSHL